MTILVDVSIQLVSPASGEYHVEAFGVVPQNIGFHSISFPSEWGVLDLKAKDDLWIRFHSISFPSEWGVEYEAGYAAYGKHGFPFN